MPNKLQLFWAGLSRPLKVFALLWLLALAWGVLLWLPVFTGSFEEEVRNMKAESIKGSPQFQVQLQAMRRQGISPAVIDRQIAQFTAPVAAACAAQRGRSVGLGLLALLVAGPVILSLAAGNPSPERRRLLLGVLVAVMLLQGFHMATRYIIPDPRNLEAVPDGIAKLKKLDPLYRVQVLDKALYNGWISEYFPLHGIPCVNVPADSRPSVWRKLCFYTPEKLSLVREMLYANVGYVLAAPGDLEALKQAGLKVRPGQSFTVNGQRQQIGEVQNPLPRFYAPRRTQVVREAEAALEIMNDPATDPRDLTLLHEGEALPEAAGKNSLKLLHYAPEKVELEADFAAPGYAVLACEPLPGWCALVDGQRLPVLRCNLLHQAVAVPAGKHAVTFAYERRELSSLLCDIMHAVFLPLLGLVTVIVLWRRRRHAQA